MTIHFQSIIECLFGNYAYPILHSQVISNSLIRDILYIRIDAKTKYAHEIITKI